METVFKDTTKYEVDTNITLTEEETKIFDTLMDVIKENNLKTTLRVAGGWVRDKVRTIPESNPLYS